MISPQPPTPQPWYIQTARLVMRWLISTLAIFVAVLIVPGIHFTGPGWELGIVAAVFGLVNVLLRPLLSIMACSLIVLTFGLFWLVINAALLLMTASIAGWLNLDFTIDGFWPAFVGGLVISIITTLLNILSGETPVRVVHHSSQEKL